MEGFFTKTRITNLIIAAALIILGIIFCALNNRLFEFLQVIGYIAAGLAIVLGILLIVMYFANGKKETSAKKFILGALAILVGLVIIISDTAIPFLLVLAIGLGICGFGIIYMAKAFEKLRVGNKDMWKEMIYGIVSVVLGLVLLILLMIVGLDVATLIYMGVAIILVGICMCVMVFLGDKVTVSVKKQIEHEDRKEEKAKEEQKKDSKNKKQ